MKNKTLGVAIVGGLSLLTIGLGLGLGLGLGFTVEANNSASKQLVSQSDSILVQNNETTEMNTFITNLMTKMTIEEKIGQMNLLTSDLDVTGQTIRAGYKDDILKGRVGALFIAFTPEYTNRLQRMAVEEPD